MPLLNGGERLYKIATMDFSLHVTRVYFIKSEKRHFLKTKNIISLIIFHMIQEFSKTWSSSDLETLKKKVTPK